MTTYTYKGDRLTDPSLKGKTCTAVRRPDGKCIRGANSNMLVDFDGGDGGGTGEVVKEKQKPPLI